MSDLEKQAQGLAATLGQVSEQAVGLVREEIELAKAEVKIKVEKVSRGLGVAIAAGVFVLVGLMFLLQALAWGLWKLIFGSDDYWGGFLLVALMLFAFGGIAGYLAYRWLQYGKKPAPQMAIDEAKLIRDTVTTTAAGETPAAPAVPGTTNPSVTQEKK